MLDNFSKKAGIKIAYDVVSESEDGYYDKSTNTLHLNPNIDISENETFNLVLKHEMTHILEQSKQYDALANYIKENFFEKCSEISGQLKRLYESENNLRRAKGMAEIKLTDERLNSEIIATFCEQLNTDKFIEKTCKENTSLAQKFITFFKDLISRLKKIGMKPTKLETVRDMWEKAFRNITYNGIKENAEQQSERDSYRLNDEISKNLFNVDENVAGKFSKQVDTWLSGSMKADEYFKLGETPVVLQEIGADNQPLVMSYSVMGRITGLKHNISIDEIKNIPQAVNDPIMVFKSATVDNAFVVLTELKDKSENDVVVAIHMNKKQKHVFINRISSIYGKENVSYFVKKQFEAGNVKYMDKIKSQNWSQSRGLQLPKLADTNPDNNIILYKDDIVNSYSMQKSKKLFRLKSPLKKQRI